MRLLGGPNGFKVLGACDRALSRLLNCYSYDYGAGHGYGGPRDAHTGLYFLSCLLANYPVAISLDLDH